MYTFFLVQQLSGAPFFTTSSKLFFGQTKIKHKYGCQKKSYPTVLVSVSYKSGIERTEKKKRPFTKYLHLSIRTFYVTKSKK
jgi:hypothetical protein